MRTLSFHIAVVAVVVTGLGSLALTSCRALGFQPTACNRDDECYPDTVCRDHVCVDGTGEGEGEGEGE